LYLNISVHGLENFLDDLYFLLHFLWIYAFSFVLDIFFQTRTHLLALKQVEVSCRQNLLGFILQSKVCSFFFYTDDVLINFLFILFFANGIVNKCVFFLFLRSLLQSCFLPYGGVDAQKHSILVSFLLRYLFFFAVA